MACRRRVTGVESFQLLDLVVKYTWYIGLFRRRTVDGNPLSLGEGSVGFDLLALDYIDVCDYLPGG